MEQSQTICKSIFKYGEALSPEHFQQAWLELIARLEMGGTQ